MAFVSANGVRLHVQRLPEPRPGTPRPVAVFVHGLIDSLASYYFTLADPVADLGFDVITYDLRGHGRSEKPAHGYGVRNAVDDLAALITELGVDQPVHLIGFSFGGTVAFSFAHRHPDRVASIVVIESEPPTKAWAERTVRDMRQVEGYIEDEPFMATQTDIVRKMAIASRRLDETTSVFRDFVDPAGLLSEADIRSIWQPLLLITGGESDLNDRVDEFVPLLPNCRVHEIPGQEHQVLTYAPREVCALLLSWLTEHEEVGAQ